MALNTSSALEAIVDLLEGISGLNAVQKGAPESYSKSVTAHVTVGGQRVVDKAGGLIQREARYFIAFAYRVQGAEATAETALAGIIDSFITAFYADRTLGGTVNANTLLDMSGADEPDYRPVAGQEVRIFPVVVVTTQQANV